MLRLWVAYNGHARRYHPHMCGHQPFNGRCVFVEGDMVEHAAALASTGCVVGLLNMACASREGGGFIRGSLSQEEVLCHRTLLFPRLCLYAADGGYPIPPRTALVTPDVKIVRDAHYERLTQDVMVHVVSAAARRWHTEEQASMHVEEVLEVLTDTWVSILAAAHDVGITTLVVSALGCGAYHNQPEVVGRALLQALTNRGASSTLQSIHMVVHNDRHGTRAEGNVARMRCSLGWPEIPQLRVIAEGCTLPPIPPSTPGRGGGPKALHNSGGGEGHTFKTTC